MRSKTVLFLAGMVLAALVLASCGARSVGEVYHVDLGATQTQFALVVNNPPTATPTPGPSPTPTLTPTPYQRPTDAPDYDGSTVITRVGGENITLDEFRKRVRFERWHPLRALAKRVERRGPEQILDLTNPENMAVAQLFVTLADSNSFGVQVHRVMVIESIARQEAARRNLELDPFQFDAKLALYLGMLPGPGGALPDEFDEEYEDFIAEMETYTGMTEDDFRRIVRAQTAYEQLEFLMGQEPQAIAGASEPQAGIEVRDAVLSTEERANEVADRLRAGEPLNEIMASLGLDAPAENTSRIVRRSDQTLPVVVVDAIYNAERDSVIGPFLMDQGWYVARVLGEKFEIMTPREIDDVRKQYFLDWVEGRMDDPAYTVDYDNWISEIPQEPLPRDVSPYFTEETIKLPEGSG
jgi:hypothetical protein